MYINKAILYGNITKDLEMRTTQGGQNVLSFSIATNRTWKDKEGVKQEEVQYHSCVAWGKTAELINQYLGKGSAILVEGRLQTRSYEAKDGTKRYTTEVVVEQMQFGPRSQKQAQGAEEQGAVEEPSEGEAPAPNEEDLPF